MQDNLGGMTYFFDYNNVLDGIRHFDDMLCDEDAKAACSEMRDWAQENDRDVRSIDDIPVGYFMDIMMKY